MTKRVPPSALWRRPQGQAGLIAGRSWERICYQERMQGRGLAWFGPFGTRWNVGWIWNSRGSSLPDQGR